MTYLHRYYDMQVQTQSLIWNIVIDSYLISLYPFSSPYILFCRLPQNDLPKNSKLIFPLYYTLSHIVIAPWIKNKHLKMSLCLQSVLHKLPGLCLSLHSHLISTSNFFSEVEMYQHHLTSSDPCPEILSEMQILPRKFSQPPQFTYFQLEFHLYKLFLTS